ncbi:MAG: redoxin protein [uncultured bacterium]|nr:MAG: redoxin protein [uncultured bacterium]
MPSNQNYSRRTAYKRGMLAAKTLLNSLFLLFFVGSVLLLSASEPASSTKLLSPGQNAPISTLNATDNIAHQFPAGGQWNMVFFWSLFCHSCIEEMPVVQAKLAEIGETGLKAYFVSLDTERMQKALVNFCKLRALKQPVLMERVASASFETADKWGVVMTPSVFIVDPAGKVAWSHQGPLDIEKFFADFQQMSQPPASTACTCEGH